MRLFPSKIIPICLCSLLLGACSASRYRQAADKEVYRILSQKESLVFGKTNAFSIDTEYSGRDPKDVPAMELVNERKLDGTNVVISLPEALKMAFANNRTFQTRREQLYLTALTLTLRRFDFEKQPFGRLGVTGERQSDQDLKLSSGSNRTGFTQALKSGGTIGATIANDMVRYFTGDPRRSITTVMSVNFMQPLLRGSSVAVVAENLKQAERDVIYAIRDFALFQQTFATDVVTSYFRLLERQANVRNAYNNYQRLSATADRAREMRVAQRMPAFQVDQALQQQLSGRSSYIRAVQQYQNQLDEFKKTLELPIGVHIILDNSSLSDLTARGLQLVNVTDRSGYERAVTNKMDILNEIDRFEDSKRKIVVAADALRANLTFLTDVSLQNDTTDYAKFDPGNFKASAGLQLDLPLNRRSQRNTYRARLIDFERQVRSLSLTLDNARDAVREDLRQLAQLNENFKIQTQALDLANQRVEATPLLIEAGRAQIRDLLEAQNAQFAAQNAVIGALVDYLDARLKFLVDLGVLNTDKAQWWFDNTELVDTSETGPVDGLADQTDGIHSPEEIFNGLAELN